MLLEGTLTNFVSGAMELFDGGWEFVTSNPLLTAVLGLGVVAAGIKAVKKVVRH